MLIIFNLPNKTIFHRKIITQCQTIKYLVQRHQSDLYEEIYNYTFRQNKYQIMPIEDFQLHSVLGKGSFGTVAKCIRKSDGQIYAMKQIKLKKLKQKDKKNALNQIRFLASIQHPNIISYKEAFYDQISEQLCVVMQFANDGDLDGKIKKGIKNGKRFPEREIWKVACQSLNGLGRLHDLKIIHRDIKAANIFFHDGNVKIGDLNVSKNLKDQFTMTQTGTPYYASPQVWNEEPYDFKSDIWSLGCLLYEMANLKPPFRADNAEALYKKITLGFYDPVSSIYSKQLANMIGKCLIVDQKQRYSTSQLLNLPKMIEAKETIEDCFVEKNDNLMNTINFPENMKNLNQKLPKAKYQNNLNKCATTKNISIGEYTPLKSRKIIIPSVKLITSDKNIDNLSVKEGKKEEKKEPTRLIKLLAKHASQKLLV